jgi:CPA2 family monovalent cation:H+ antiporter-2
VGFVAGTLLVRSFMTQLAIPRIMKYRSPDLVVLLAIVVLGSVTLIAYRVGLPAAIGALAAGIILGETRWAEQIDSLILPFREVFSAIFFVSLGLLIDSAAVMQEPLTVASLISLLILTKLLAGWVALWTTGLSWRRALGPALALAHVGEFSFVVLLLASQSDFLNGSQRQLVMAATGGSILLAPLLIRIGFHQLDDLTDDQSGQLPRLRSESADEKLHQAVIIGMGPIGRATASQLESLGYQVACIDLNPLNLQAFSQLGIRTIAGNAQQPEVLESAGVGQSTLVIVCVPHDEIAQRVTELCRKLNAKAKIVVRCRYLNTAALLRQAGATHVVSEEANAAMQLVDLIARSH